MMWRTIGLAVASGLIVSAAAEGREDVSPAVSEATETCLRQFAPDVERSVASLSEAANFLTDHLCLETMAADRADRRRRAVARREAAVEAMWAAHAAQGAIQTVDQSPHDTWMRRAEDAPAEDEASQTRGDVRVMVRAASDPGEEFGEMFGWGPPSRDADAAALQLAARLLLELRISREETPQ